METDVSYDLENAQQFWDELREIVTANSDTHELIDNTLRTYIAFTTQFKEQYLQSEYDLARCSYELLGSSLFKNNGPYVRRQFVYGLLQEDAPPVLHVIAAFLLFDGRSYEETFQMMQDEGAFIRLLDLIKSRGEDDTGLHRLLLELLCDMSRIQQLSYEDLKMVDDDFIVYLFQLIEQLSDDASDPYHYPIIRILLVLNEQYMCFSQTPTQHTSASEPIPAPLTNRIIKILSSHGPSYRTFGENLILLLNRESAMGPQLLILKLLYLLFTTPPTFEYFYTNDLHVLVDVIIRNLLDLDPNSDEDTGNGAEPEGGGHKALRHTYLRVLCPLLRNTQLAQDDGHYKREELRKVFYLLVNSSSFHFAPADDTVVRLVSRCKQIEWLRDESDDPKVEQDDNTIVSPTGGEPDVGKKLLGIGLNVEAGHSTLSILDVAAKVDKAKPKPPAPRRKKRLPTQTSHDVEKESGLKVPQIARTTPSNSSGQTGDRSPFADDYE